MTESDTESCDEEAMENLTEEDVVESTRTLPALDFPPVPGSPPGSPINRDPNSPRSPSPPPPLPQQQPLPDPDRERPDAFDYTKSAKELTADLLEKHQFTCEHCREKTTLDYDRCPFAIKHEINFSHAIKLQVRESSEKSKKNKDRLVRLLGGAQVKQARMNAELSSHLQVNPRRIRAVVEVTGDLEQQKRNEEWKEKITGMVINFYNSDVISRQMPGKKDRIVKRENGERETFQTKVLNDYQEVNFDRFKTEFPDEKIGRTLFFSLRPDYVFTSAHMKGFSCLCTKHENFGLLLKSARPYFEEHFPINPDAFHRKVETLAEMKRILDETAFPAVEDDDKVGIRQWRSVQVKSFSKKTGKPVTTRKTKCMPDVVDMIALKKKLIEQYTAFIVHSYRIRSQHSFIKHLKATLKIGELIVYEDYAENHSLKPGDRAVQSSYWNQQFVTMHCICVYWRGLDGEIHYQSFVYLSSIMSHDSAFVITCHKSLLKKDLKEVVKDDITFHFMHFISDSPMNQYRNKYDAEFTSLIEELFGIKAAHHYTEAGHGKSVCDGIGGSFKRRADEASLSGRHVITTTQELYKYAVIEEKNIKPIYVSEYAYDVTMKDIIIWGDFLSPLKGAVELHTVIPIDQGIVATNEVSCPCDKCREFHVLRCSNHTYKIVKLHKEKKLPSGEMEPFLPESVTACSEGSCRYLCTCEYDECDDMPTLHYRKEEEELLRVEEIVDDEDLPDYVGHDGLPTDTIDQEGNNIKMLNMYIYNVHVPIILSEINFVIMSEIVHYVRNDLFYRCF